MSDVTQALQSIVSSKHVLRGEDIVEDYTHDEALNLQGVQPAWVVRPATSEHVAAILRVANEHRIPVTVRGAGTGMSGACIPSEGGIVLSTERMKRIEIDADNHMAVVEPGVTLAELEEAAQPHGLCYPVQPGEDSASIGGNVATNAGGMRAVKYGVTRNQVLGLTAVLASGDIIDCGGKFVKSSSGYDLTQLIIGSEGTLAVVTRIIVRLFPRLTARTSLLAPFEEVEQITRAVPKIVHAGAAPLFVEYLDALSMIALCKRQNIDLGISEAMQQQAKAYLLIELEGRSEQENQDNAERLGPICLEQGAIDVFVLPKNQANKVIQGREESFWAGKAAGLNDQVDVVVPRASLADYMARVQEIAAQHETFIVGTGHAGDGNVHLGIFQPDDTKRSHVMNALFDVGIQMGGMVSAEHGIGLAKKKYFEAREQPAKLALMRRIKAAFDPNGIMNPGKVFEPNP